MLSLKVPKLDVSSCIPHGSGVYQMAPSLRQVDVWALRACTICMRIYLGDPCQISNSDPLTTLYCSLL